MTRIVCLICDTPKRVGNGHHCDECGRETTDRSVAQDYEPIAPASTVTFERQRELFEQERKRS